MTKEEVFTYFNTKGIDKSGFLKKESGFSKTYPALYEELKTWSYPKEFTFTQLLYHFLQDDNEFKLGICPVDKNRCTFLGFRKGYSECCSLHCLQNYDKHKEKIFNTKLLHYNDGSFTNRDKFIKTMNDKSDDDKLLSNHKRSVSLKQTYKKRGEQINDAKCNTKLIKYGNPTYNNRTKFIETYNNKTDAEKQLAIQLMKETKKQRYNDENYCNSKQIKETANQKMINQYPDIISINGKICTVKCPNCGNTYEISKRMFMQRITHNHIPCVICNPKRKFWSIGEKEMCEYIKSIYSGVIIENDRKILKPYEIDCFLPDLNIGFEYQGDFWHHDKKCKSRDKKKKSIADNIGIEIYYVWESEWINNNSVIKETILSIINDKRRNF